MGSIRQTAGCGQDRSPIEACRLHPFEFAVAGFSGSGKTTLLEKLVPLLAPLRVGYLKHDAHRPDLDREGKDTFRLVCCIDINSTNLALRDAHSMGSSGRTDSLFSSETLH